MLMGGIKNLEKRKKKKAHLTILVEHYTNFCMLEKNGSGFLDGI